MTFAAFVAVFIACAASSCALNIPSGPSSRPYDAVTPSLSLPATIYGNLAQYSPWFPASEYNNPPAECIVTQVNILQRHGARYPTAGAGKDIQAALFKLQAVPTYSDPRLDFIKSFKYDLGVADLVPFGAAQSFDAGQAAFVRYGALLSDDKMPFVRSTSMPRVVNSANNWTAGFAAASQSRYEPVLTVVLSESANDTLDNNLCPNAGDGDAQQNAWLAIFGPPIAARLNAAAPGANITADDAQNLISLCAFDSVAHGRASAACGMFADAEFADYEYYGDLGKFYGTGPGGPLGRVQGVGYVNELLARLTGQPVRDATQTNATLDGAAATFPLGRALYADFTHDDLLIAVYDALGLFPGAPLDPVRPAAAAARGYVVSRLVPFSARLVTERLDCGGEARVRVLVNEEVQPLGFCGAGEDGVCTLDAFVQSQAYARSNGAGDWQKCTVTA